MTTPLPHPVDVELRLIDPARNAFRRYGLTACTTLFGQPCLRIQWGRVGHRARERSETFPTGEALERRCSELLSLRRQHGYRPVAELANSALGPPLEKRPERRKPKRRVAVHPDGDAPLPCPWPATAKARAVERDIVEAHGLPLDERAAQQLVVRWHDATCALARYLEERSAEHLDLIDVSTLAALYIDARAS